MALKVKDAYQLLGSDAKNVVFVLVTTDPKTDTPSVTAAHSRALGDFDVWHFGGGPAGAVQAVWANYGIGVSVDPDTSATARRVQGARRIPRPSPPRVCRTRTSPWLARSSRSSAAATM